MSFDTGGEYKHAVAILVTGLGLILQKIEDNRVEQKIFSLSLDHRGRQQHEYWHVGGESNSSDYIQQSRAAQGSATHRDHALLVSVNMQS